MTLLRLLIAPLAGYPIYAIIATFTSFDYWPSSGVQWAVLGGLMGMAVLGMLMDIGSESAARRGEPAALKYRSDWGLHDPRDRR